MKYQSANDPAPLGYASSIHAMFRQNNFQMLCDHTPMSEGGFWICRQDEAGQEQAVLEVRLMTGVVEAYYLWSMENEQKSRSRRLFKLNEREIMISLERGASAFPDFVRNSCNIMVFIGKHVSSMGRRVNVVFPDQTAVIVQRGTQEILYATPKAQTMGIYASRSFERLANIPV